MLKNAFLSNNRNRCKKIFYLCIIFMMISYLFSPLINRSYAYDQGRVNWGGWINSDYYPGYQELISALKQAHPNWDFTIFYTGIDWDQVIINETTALHTRSLVPKDKPDSWICPECGRETFEGGGWCCASQAAVAYYMDPRNFINEATIFQFETLSYVEGIQTKEGVQKILSGTFMDKNEVTYTNTSGGTSTIYKSYADIIMEAAKESGVSPYHLASRMRQEQGVTGTPLSRGEVSNYIGYYNFFNIGASGSSVLTNGAKRAKNEGWDNPEKSIKGGANFLAKNYISRGQDCLYLQKFDVDERNGLYGNQYMQNIMAPSSECTSIRSSYQDLGMLDQKFNFVIPVYENMPKTACGEPGTDGFVPDLVPMEGERVKVNTQSMALAVRSSPSTNATILTSLPKGTELTRIARAKQTDSKGIWWDKVQTDDGIVGYASGEYLLLVKEGTPVNPEPEPEPEPEPPDVQGGNVIIDEENKYVITEPNVGLGDIKKKVGDNSITSNTQKIGTGTIITIKGSAYRAVKMGDVSGDAEIDARDSLRILNYTVGQYDLNYEFFKAADLNKDGVVDSRDSLRILKYVVGEFKITI